MQLQISDSFLFSVQISFGGFRKLFFHVPACLPLYNLIASFQSQTFDKKKGDAPMSEYADSHLTVAPHFFVYLTIFFFFAQHKQSKFIIQIKTVIIFW